MKTIDLSNAPWHYKAIKLAGLDRELRYSPDSCTYVKLLMLAAFRLLIVPVFLIMMAVMFVWASWSIGSSLLNGASLKDAFEAFRFSFREYTLPFGYVGIAFKLALATALIVDLFIILAALAVLIVIAVFCGWTLIERFLKKQQESDLTMLYRSWRDKYCVQLKLPEDK